MAAIALVAGMTSTTLDAELSGDEYLGGGAIGDAAQRARVQALIDAERQREAERARDLERKQAGEATRRRLQRAAEAAS
jgi:hypothetical protein